MSTDNVSSAPPRTESTASRQSQSEADEALTISAQGTAVSGVSLVGIIVTTSESALVDPADSALDGKALKVAPHFS